jgi:hypothetical protein
MIEGIKYRDGNYTVELRNEFKTVWTALVGGRLVQRPLDQKADAEKAAADYADALREKRVCFQS